MNALVFCATLVLFVADTCTSLGQEVTCSEVLANDVKRVIEQCAITNNITLPKTGAVMHAEVAERRVRRGAILEEKKQLLKDAITLADCLLMEASISKEPNVIDVREKCEADGKLADLLNPCILGRIVELCGFLKPK